MYGMGGRAVSKRPNRDHIRKEKFCWPTVIESLNPSWWVGVAKLVGVSVWYRLLRSGWTRKQTK